MKSFLDLVQEDSFRNYVSGRIASEAGSTDYSFPNEFPLLYRYRGLTDYSVEDIINGNITLTSIGNFNDLFDGAVHRYGTDVERENAAEKDWENLGALIQSVLNHDDYIENAINRYHTDSRLKFRLLSYLGTFVGCFSTTNNSTLMWSHYADSNSGICIEYDFNQLDSNSIHRKSLFPVSYLHEPLNLADLLDDTNREVCLYPADAAVLCAALTKADAWKYENEWRIVLLLPGLSSIPRFPIHLNLKPLSICFGYHFLKPLFYYDSSNIDELNKATEKIALLIKLIDYSASNNIQLNVAVPQIGNHILSPTPIDSQELRNFIVYYFRNNKPQDVKFYYTIHDQLMDILEKGCN